MEFIQSRSGCRQIIYQGYNYNRERREAPNDPKSVWRCVEYSGPFQCPGRMTVIRGRPITGAPHNHDPFSPKITVKRIMNRMKLEALDMNRDSDPADIIEELTRDATDEVRSALPSDQMMRRMILRLRNKDKGSGHSILQHQIKRLNKRLPPPPKSEDSKDIDMDRGGMVDLRTNGDPRSSPTRVDVPQNADTPHSYTSNLESSTDDLSMVDVNKSFKFWRKVGNLGLMPDFIQEIKSFLDDVQRVLSQQVPPTQSKEYTEMEEYSKQLSFVVTELGLTPRLKDKLTHHQNCVIMEQEKNRRELMVLKKRMKAQEAKQEELEKRTQYFNELLKEQNELLVESKRAGSSSTLPIKDEGSEGKDWMGINGTDAVLISHNCSDGGDLANNTEPMVMDDQRSIFFGHSQNNSHHHRNENNDDVVDDNNASHSTPLLYKLSHPEKHVQTTTSAIYELGQALGLFNDISEERSELEGKMVNRDESGAIENYTNGHDVSHRYIDIISSATICGVTSSLATNKFLSKASKVGKKRKISESNKNADIC